MAFEQFSQGIDSIHFHDSAPLLSSLSKTNIETSHRGRVKKIITNRTTGESFFHKAVTTDTEPDSVNNLVREFSFLEKLAASDVTPKPYLLKLSIDQSQGALAIETLPGKSLHECQAKSRRINSKLFDSLLTKTFNALNIIHQNGILIGDITSESFIIDSNHKRGIESVKIVDFEHAIDNSEIAKIPDNIKKAYAQEDIGLYAQLQSGNRLFSFNELVCTEQYIAALTLLRYMLGSTYEWTVDEGSLSETDALLFQHQTQELMSVATQKAEAIIMKRYMRFGEDYAYEIAHQEAFCQVREDMKIYMINITLPYLLEQKGIEIEGEHIYQLQQMLNPDLQKRV